MNYFHPDISKSINTVVYFDWKTVIFIYACRQCRIQCYQLTILHLIAMTTLYAVLYVDNEYSSVIDTAQSKGHFKVFG
jgi:hypothetical protein